MVLTFTIHGFLNFFSCDYLLQASSAMREHMFDLVKDTSTKFDY